MALRVIKRNRYRDLEQLGLVTNCDGYLLVSLDFFRFRPTAMEIWFFNRNEAQEQHSLLDTIFDNIFDFGPPGKYLYLSPQNLLHVCWPAEPANM